MKVTRTRAIALAVILFELEIDSICNDAKDHFHFNGWTEKFGPSVHKLAERLTSSKNNQFNAHAIDKMASEIQADFESGVWTPCHNGELYNHMMTNKYGGHIDRALESQLGMLSGVGVQTKLFA